MILPFKNIVLSPTIISMVSISIYRCNDVLSAANLLKLDYLLHPL